MSGRPSESGWLRRRFVLDRILSGLGLVVTAPVTALLALAVRLADGGPAIIGVQRVGLGRQPFSMLKLRSMRALSASGAAGGVALTRSNDDRVTPIGKWLRSYHLDELPQLVNVVRGHMALLGPRPEAPEWVTAAQPRWETVLAVRPGVAGPTQLIIDEWERALIEASPDGAEYLSTVLPVKLAIDEWYVVSASPRDDALILASLFQKVALGTRPRRLEALIRRSVPEASAPLDWMDERQM